MLSVEERLEIESELRAAPTRRSVATDALKIVQRHRGWVCDEAIKDVAALLDMSPADLDGLATCYNGIYRRPVGRHVILICDSVSCWIMGYLTLREWLESRLGIGLGQTTADGRFTLLPAACLGLCEQAPAVMIDDDVHGDLTPDKLDTILERYA